jgi:hypothetical protein
MATATLTPTSTGQSIKTSNETYRTYVQLDAEGKKIVKTSFGTAGKDNAFWNKLDAPDSGFQIGLEQTVKRYKAGSVEGCSEIIPDPDEFVNIFNRGLDQKFNQKINGVLTETTDDATQLAFNPQADAFDTIDLLREPTQRRNLSDNEKAEINMKAGLRTLYPGKTDAEYHALWLAVMSLQ